ncbi:response regulator [Anaerolineales bacterium HSG24]|nr:response regulator [Anaerolineales bacterium HSG24]
MTQQAILCVDDEPMILMNLRDQLANHFGEQYDYEFAENAAEAWEVIDEMAEDGIILLAIICDWLMPEVKGDEFLIDVHQQYPSVIKILLTGQADPAAVDRLKKQTQLQAYLVKPWDRKNLLEILELKLRGAHAERFDCVC